MTLQEFIDKWKGKGIDYDGRYGFQCVDLYRQYCKEVLNIPQSPSVRGASEIWTTYLKEYFDAVPNTPDGIPDAGDIVVWNKRMGKGFGHVAVVINADINNLEVFEQDGSVQSVAQIKVRKYTNTYGWLKFKKPIIPGPDENPVEKWLKGFFHEKGLVDRFSDYKSIIASWWDNSNKYEDLHKALDGWENFRDDLTDTISSGREFNEILVRSAELRRKEKEYISLKKYTEDFKDKVCISQEEYDRLKEKKVLDRFTMFELVNEIIRRVTPGR